MIRRTITLRPLLVLLILAAGAAACSFDAAGIASREEVDAVAPVSLDLGELRDISAGDLVAWDGQRADRSYPDKDSDVGLADARPLPDTTPPPDTKPLPDTTPPPDTKPPPTCDQKYGAAASYKLCSKTATSCTFYTKSNDTCGNVCKKYGGTCQAAAAEVSDSCSVSYTTPCSTTHGDGICTCSK